jgi:hypothetical protein
MTDGKAQYVVGHYGHLMSSTEKSAFRHLSATMKATKGKSDVAAQEAARQRKFPEGLFSSDPEVLRLAKDGYDSFIERTAERILREHADDIRLNFCPKCGELARTPQAKQCRYCEHDWHSSGVKK